VSAQFVPTAVGSTPTVALSGTLTDKYGNILSQNGGSCLWTQVMTQ
jgi:hypothetical protein